MSQPSWKVSCFPWRSWSGQLDALLLTTGLLLFSLFAVLITSISRVLGMSGTFCCLAAEPDMSHGKVWALMHRAVLAHFCPTYPSLRPFVSRVTVDTYTFELFFPFKSCHLRALLFQLRMDKFCTIYNRFPFGGLISRNRQIDPIVLHFNNDRPMLHKSTADQNMTGFAIWVVLRKSKKI